MQRMKPPERITTEKYVLLMVVQSVCSVEVYVSGTELRSSDAAMKGAQTKLRKEVCALGMEQRLTAKTMQHRRMHKSS
jgi:hypothetical protein